MGYKILVHVEYYKGERRQTNRAASFSEGLMQRTAKRANPTLPIYYYQIGDEMAWHLNTEKEEHFWIQELKNNVYYEN